MKIIKVYEYPNCSTCRKATNWLTNQRYPVERVDITKTPPSMAELKEMLKIQNGNIKKLFNTTGHAYREQGFKEKLAGMKDDEALKLLHGNGMLIKRPFVLWDGKGVVGFELETWKKLFA